MKYTSLLLGLFLCLAARADTVTNLAGVIHDPQERIVYTFTVDTTDFPTFIEDTLNGSVRITGGGAPQSITYQNDLFLFEPGQTIAMADFGSPILWELDDTPGGLVLHDPPNVATPEPSTWIAALIGFFLAGCLRRKLLK